MSFIRPEAAQWLHRWRETLAGAAAAGLGAYWTVTDNGALTIIGTGLTIGGALLVFAGVQRARFRRGGGGSGMVQVDEGQLTYFGPHDGGIAAISEVTRLDLDPRHGGEGAWIVFHRGGNPLTIPVNAAGADALFDVFAALPGIETGDLLAKLNATPAQQIVIWEREPKRLH
ncbi:hypothetical protein [Ovoidimarina sediminis]|uniref:hypothetical protein n=1 Tax=Ovoidimarina sediminis TaxID=3079856 RepID=UPI002907417D|nr:hypothetical protein [Rhodophyticola sp. MJ-SS7]MDU8946073.1 hypothetical protein [Rhodophyticola sp. MJ-SS7]